MPNCSAPPNQTTGSSGSSCRVFSSGSGADDPCCKGDAACAACYGIFSNHQGTKSFTVCSCGKYVLTRGAFPIVPDPEGALPLVGQTSVNYVLRIPRKADSGIVFDISDLTQAYGAAWQIEAVKPGASHQVFGDETLNNFSTPSFEFVNTSHYRVYVIGSKKCNDLKGIEGVSNQIGVGPGESLTLAYDAGAKFWSVTHSVC